MREFQVENLRKTMGEKQLFASLSFLIQEGDRIGLIGLNGTGKSTLLNVLSEAESYDGDVLPFTYPKDYKIVSLSQEHSFDMESSVATAVFSGDSEEMRVLKNYEIALMELETNPTQPQLQERFSRMEDQMNKLNLWSIESSAKSILNKLGVDLLQKKISELSGGQQKRVQLANALLSDCDLLLLDEPTNHLDYATIQWLAAYLKNFKGAILFVTHDRYFLDNVSNRVFELENGSLLEFQGNYQNYLEERFKLDEMNKLEQHKQHQLYKQELAWMRKGVEARRTKQQARINRFENLKESMEGNAPSREMILDFSSQRIGKKVILAKDATVVLGDAPLFEDLELLIQNDTRLGITGANGSGKSTLLNVLAGEFPLTSGEISIGETVNIAYYKQQNEDLPNEKRMLTFLQEEANVVQSSRGEEVSIPEMLERFLFPRHTHGSLIGRLSGGEKRRLYLLKLLIQRPNVLFLDEPTNDLDIQTLTILEDYIKQFKGAVIAVSHDRYFLDKTMNELLIFQGKGVIQHTLDSITEFLEKEATAKQEVLATQKEANEDKIETLAKEKTKLTYMERKEFDSIESEIDQLEKRIETIDNEMNNFGADYELLATLQKELDSVTGELSEKYERWEYLSEYS